MATRTPSNAALLDEIRERLLRALPAAEPVDRAPHLGAAEPNDLIWNRSELQRFRHLQRDYPERTGKFLRGCIVALSAAAHGAAISERVLDVAAAIELFQAWVLVHDDIEDDSETRRGQPALHRTVGMPIALNVGDAMHLQMWRLLHRSLASQPTTLRAVLDEFGQMIERTAEGQHLDLSYVQSGRFEVSEAEYLDMVTRKTAYYTVVSPLRLGALLAGVAPAAEFSSAGVDLGVAFQIRDDVINLQRDENFSAYGKEFAGDLYEGKRTLILAHMLAAGEQPQRDRVTALLSRQRRERSADDVEEILDLIEHHGSLDYAQRVASRRAARGLASLSTALADLPGQDAAAELLELLAGVAERRH